MFGGVALGAAPQQDAGTLDLLGVVQQAYASLRSYHIVIEEDVLSAEVTLGQRVQTIEIVYQDAAHFRYDGVGYGGPSRFRLTIVHDGQTIWAHRADLNQYIAEADTPASNRRGRPWAINTFARLHARYVHRFQHVRSLAESARVVGHAEMRFGNAKVKTVIVEIQAQIEGRPRRERLWIHPDLHLVLRSDIASRAGDPRAAGSWKSTIYTYSRVDEPLPPQLFQFAPPKRARRMERFRFQRRSGAEPEALVLRGQ